MPPPELAPAPLAPVVRSRRRTAGIIGLGRALPTTVVENASIAERIGVEPAWITKRTGISARRRCGEGEGLSQLCIEAGDRALDAAGVDPTYVDAVLVATSSADDIVPQAAPVVAGALGADRAMTWDVGLACTGFLAGLQQGAALIPPWLVRFWCDLLGPDRVFLSYGSSEQVGFVACRGDEWLEQLRE